MTDRLRIFEVNREGLASLTTAKRAEKAQATLAAAWDAAGAAAWDAAGAADDEIHGFGCPLYPSHAPNWPAA